MSSLIGSLTEGTVSDKPLQAIQDVIRQPWYQFENSSRTLDTDAYKDQTIVNMIPEKNMDFSTQTVETQMTKRPGFLAANTNFLSSIVAGGFNPDACTVRDFICITALFDVFILTVFEETTLSFLTLQIRPITGTNTLLHSIAGASADSAYLSEISQTSGGSLVPGVALNLVKANYSSSAAYYAVSSAGSMGALTAITDVHYPALQTPALIPIGKIINQRGTFYVATLDGRIWNSYPVQNDINAWANATSQIGSIKTDMYPDQLLGLERIKNNIVAFSRNSIEFFQEIGTSVNNPSTLAAMDQAFIKFGAIKQDLIRNIDDVLYWVAYGQDGQTGLWHLDGYTPVKLSTPYVDALITNQASTLNSRFFNLQSCVMNGKRQIFLNGISAHGLLQYTTGFNAADNYPIDVNDDSSTSAYIYNVEDKTWWGFNSGMENTCAPRFATSFASPSQGGLYSQYMFIDSATAAVSKYCFKIRADAIYSDDVTSVSTTPVCAYAQTNSFWFDNEKRKRISKFKIIANTIPIQAADGKVYKLYFIYNKDNTAITSGGFLPNTTVRGIVNPPAQGRYVFNNLGMARVWNFAIIEKSAMNLRLKAFEIDIQQGSH